jgi:hypothetical protein
MTAGDAECLRCTPEVHWTVFHDQRDVHDAGARTTEETGTCTHRQTALATGNTVDKRRDRRVPMVSANGGMADALLPHLSEGYQIVPTEIESVRCVADGRR